jgi:hypothetical protein
MDASQLAELRQLHACSTSYGPSSSAECGDAHLMLSIPWCGRQLRWQVIARMQSGWVMGQGAAA